MQIKDKSSKKQQIQSKYIVSQDRNCIVKYTKYSILSMVPVFCEDELSEYNLICDGHLLGTFCSIDEVAKEMSNIQDARDVVYSVGGYDGDMEDDE